MFPLFMWCLCAFAFTTVYMVRVTPVSILPELAITFQVPVTQVSLFAPYFLYAFTFMQIPVGVLIDKYSVRVMLSIATLLCAVATVIFTQTHSLIIAQWMRSLAGLGAAFAFIGAVKIALLWFKPNQFSILVGCTQSLGMVGGAIGAMLIGFLTSQYTWQNTLLGLGCILGMLAFLIAVFVKRPASFEQKALQLPDLSLLVNLKKVFTNRSLWVVSFYWGMLTAPTVTISELWGSVYLMQTQWMPKAQANSVISTMFIGLALAGPFSGWFANLWGRKPVMIGAAFFSLIFIATFLYAPQLPLYGWHLVAFSFGFCNSAGSTAACTTAAELTDKSTAGLSVGLISAIAIFINAVFQQTTGVLVYNLDKQIHNHIQSLLPSSQNLKMAMILIVLGALISFVISLFTRETRSTHE